MNVDKTDFRSNLLFPNTLFPFSAPKHASNDNSQQLIIRLNEHLAYHIMFMHHVETTLFIKPPKIDLDKRKPKYPQNMPTFFLYTSTASSETHHLWYWDKGVGHNCVNWRYLIWSLFSTQS
jgi:hypothetical protein